MTKNAPPSRMFKRMSQTLNRPGRAVTHPVRAAAFTILEALIAVVILTASIGSLAILVTRQWSTTSDVDVLDLVENAVAADLGWLKTYAKYWHMTSGPYNLTCTQVGFGADCQNDTPFQFSSTSIEYQPDPNASRCPGATATTTETDLASDFVSDANSSAADTLKPDRPHDVAVGDTMLLESGSANRLPPQTKLIRNIRLGRNLIYLTYTLEGPRVASYGFRREVALYPEAAAWCP